MATTLMPTHAELKQAGMDAREEACSKIRRLAISGVLLR